MLNYLKWISISGVWGPVAILLAWGVFTFVVGTIRPQEGYGLVVIGVMLTFALSHALAFSSVIALGLVVTRQASRPKWTLLSAIVGGLISALMLSRIYFNASI